MIQSNLRYSVFHPQLIRYISLFSLIILCWFARPGDAESQALRALANNTFAGAITGAGLGAATMALADSDDVGMLRVGVGVGTLAGMGVGIYDAGNNLGHVQGTFNSVPYSGYIIMVDTFYGAATGAIGGMAIALLGNNRIATGAQYGVGIGAWAGFAFGVVDAFYLSHQYDDFDYFSSADNGNGLIQLQTGTHSQIGFLNPSLFVFPQLENQSLTMAPRYGLELANVSFRF